MKQKSLAMMDAILGAISESREWNDYQKAFPAVAEALSRMNAALERAREFLPQNVYDELEIAEGGGLSALGEAGILFGIHVGNVIRETVAASAAFSPYMPNSQQGGKEVNRDKESALAADLMDKIAQSDEWQDILILDTGITAASKRLESAIDAIRAHAPASAIEELESAAYLYGGAIEIPAMLFGFRAAVALGRSA